MSAGFLAAAPHHHTHTHTHTSSGIMHAHMRPTHGSMTHAAISSPPKHHHHHMHHHYLHHHQTTSRLRTAIASSLSSQHPGESSEAHKQHKQQTPRERVWPECLGKCRAFFVDHQTIAVPPELISHHGGGANLQSATLYASRDAQIHAGLANEVNLPHADGNASFSLTHVGNVTPEIANRFPHISHYAAFQLDTASLNLVANKQAAAYLLTCQLAVSIQADEHTTYTTGVQTAGVLDSLYAYDGPLGVTFPQVGVTRLTLWAPTAQNVSARFYNSPPDKRFDDQSALYELTRDDDSGAWSVDIPSDEAYNKFFVYEMRVFVPWTNHIESVTATDPYAHSLSANGLSVHVIDVMNDLSTMPHNAHWDTVRTPHCNHPTDMAIYELHVRDFSASDQCVPEHMRGTFAAFALPPSTSAPPNAECSQGVAHLARLAESGMTHVHLLPINDFGSVDERKERWQWPHVPHDAAPDSDMQQGAVMSVANDDAYNWGYDPVHFLAPDGSYATDPDGAARVREMRGVTASMANLGLGVVADVVFNHTYAAGCTAHTSVLDKVVPGYYYRRNGDGDIENSTCMNNTASEHYMCERLIVDAVVHWARTYKLSGFRFDLMGHLMMRTMNKVRDALNALNVQEHGVDGSRVYLYGEGWDFGEVAGNARGVNAGQLNLHGSGIGSFNDRIREAVVGGSPFGDPRDQGFATGLGTDPSEYTAAGTTPDEQQRVLIESSERLMCSLAGNLRDSVFLKASCRATDAKETFTMGRDAAWLGSNCGYARNPDETVNYVSAHDNETLFDMIVWKLRASPHEPTSSGLLPPEEFARRSIFCSACVAYAQGVPFFHAGDEILRSKSLDRDSYNSGDHFNRLLWDMSGNNFGVGLPPAEKNAEKYDMIRPLLANRASLAPDANLIRRTSEAFQELLRVRRSSPLFRLRTQEDVQARMFFDAPLEDGVVVFAIVDGGERGAAPELSQLDAHHAMVVVVLNARAETYVHKCGVDPASPPPTATLDELRLPPRRLGHLLDAWKRDGRQLNVHPELQGSVDDVTRECRVLPTRGHGEVGFALSVPPSTAAVFVATRD